jgi:hypothetical protein
MRKIVRDSLLSFGAFKRAKPGIHIINSHYVTQGPIHNKNEDWEMSIVI